MDNIIKFKKEVNFVFEWANKKCDSGDFIGALSSLLAESVKNPDCADVYAHIADVYTELGLYENAICFWFKYLLKSKKKFYCDGFNGLGANYYFSGDKNLAGYYFGEQLKNDNGEPSVYDDVLEEFRDELLNVKPNIHLVEEESKEDLNLKIVEDAKEYNKTGAYNSAIELLNSINEDSVYYGQALSERAFSHFCIDNPSQAVADVKTSIEKGFITVNSLTFAIHLYIATGTDGIEELMNLLINLNVESINDKYKKLTALCEFYLDNDALLLTDEILSIDKFDVNTIFIKAFLTYNKGDYAQAEKLFQNAYILSYNPIALYYLRLTRRALQGDVKYKELKIAFDLPSDEIDEVSDIIKNLLSGTKSIFEFPHERIKEIADWSFTCGSQSSQIALAVIFAKCGDLSYIEYIVEQLVNPSLSDDVKMRIVSLICEYTNLKEIKVVYSHVFKTIKINRPLFEQQNNVTFNKAFAFAFGRMTVFENKKLHLLEIGAVELQKELISTNQVEQKFEVPELACAMYFYSGMGTFKNSDVVYRIFDVKKDEVVKIIKLTEENDNGN